MNSRLSIDATVAAVLAIFALAGCGNGAADAPKTVPVTGTVTLAGAPLANATIQFTPTDATKMNPCSGITNAQGKYELVQSVNKGAVPGPYKVTIEYYAKPDGTAAVLEDGIDIEQLKKQGLVQQALPAKYSDLEQTELKADVSDKRDQKFDFSLTKE